ncbi:MAG TPA: PASTA domain-containing protein [Mycobacteriales bacterium]|nr:PASTA domain-containing protein [Mycobacteriales bacterium]
MTTTPDDAPTPLETVGERYVLVARVEADGDREVWRGHDDLASRPVAVTRYLDATAEWRASFDRRARKLESLSDPGIATVLRHDAHDDAPWIASTWVDGETVATIATTTGFTVDDALAVIGQSAFALAAAHEAGIGHGRLDADHVIVRPDGSVALIGFAVTADPSPAADLVALRAIAVGLIDAGNATSDVVGFLDGLAGKGGSGRDDPAEIARTALALASAQRGGQSSGAITPTAGTDDDADRQAEAPRPWYTEEERKRVRNRLVALGAIVVIGGAILLRIFSSGAGQATVPPVVGLPFTQAQHQLNEVGLRASETLTTGPVGSIGTVIAQDPPGGTRAKVGGVVHLTVATTETR